ncbi:MAG: MBL fold metallo-hydrolase, partial [Candidatus Firestonebacteria bacterium]
MTIEVKFLGAARTVTGSKYLISNDSTKILVDCGMFQGPKELTELNYEVFGFEPSELNYVVLTHAHIDHSGLVPRLIRKGFRGKILTTKATMDLCKIMFIDVAHIESIELEWRNRKRVRAGKEPLEPVYTVSDAEEAMKYFEVKEYNRFFEAGGFKIRFVDAGHILGSAIVELNYKDKKKNKKLVFSGDIGNESQKILNDPAKLKEADYLFVESTYGDRLHKTRKETINELIGII